MAFGNFKQMAKGGSLVSEGFGNFFATCKAMKTIKKLKASHDYAWYNEYLKTSKKFREFFMQYCDQENVAIIPTTDLSNIDNDMLTLYLNEVFVSHNVISKFNKDENVYILELTDEYINSK